MQCVLVLTFAFSLASLATSGYYPVCLVSVGYDKMRHHSRRRYKLFSTMRDSASKPPPRVSVLPVSPSRIRGLVFVTLFDDGGADCRLASESSHHFLLTSTTPCRWPATDCRAGLGVQYIRACQRRRRQAPGPTRRQMDSHVGRHDIHNSAAFAAAAAAAADWLTCST